MRALVLSLLAMVLLGACTAPLPRDSSCRAMQIGLTSADAERTPSRIAILNEISAMAETFARRTGPARPVIDVALLSSGGQWGAFSAGFMTGWSENTRDPRPEQFEIVTGVSTGALMAPFVFAGQEYDPILRELYYGVEERRILRRRTALELVRSPSIWDSSPLARLVQSHLTPELIANLAQGSEDRSLLVGAVNLESGFFEAFDLTAMAASDNDDKVLCLREGLMASAAIPVLFPPRRIGNQLYVDGAARQGVFLQGLAEIRARPRIYVLLNNSVGFPTETTDFALPALVSRSSSIASDELLRQSTIEAVRFAKSKGWTVRGIVAPDISPGPECELPSGSQMAFCPDFTKRLFEAGYARAASGRIDWLNADQLIAELRRQQAVAQGRTN